MVTEILDVAVVGGGVSGVYSAWRLATHKPNKKQPKKIELFELSQRIGGRLLSLTPPGMPHIRCELGGMRFMSTHTLVVGLVQKKLKLPTEELPVDEPENIAYLRGKRLRLKDLTDPTLVPYNVDWAERGQDPGSLVAYAIHQLVPGSEKFTAKDWLAAQKNFVFEGKPLYDHGFWNMLAQVLSHEGYMFAQDASGYDSLASNWNAADAMPFNVGDFGVDAKYYRVTDGYEQVPMTLLKLFEEAGGKTHLGYRLKSFNTTKLPDNTTGIELKFEVSQSSKPGKRGAKKKEQEEAEEITILARSVILAMPRRSLELLDQTGAVLDPGNTEVHQLIQSVHPIPLFKIFVCYHTPWWQAAGVSQGRTVTDLPVRQCYYWGTEGDQAGADKNNRNSVLLASYDDMRSVTFWAGLREDTQMHEPLPNPFAKKHPSPRWRDYKAPAAMVAEIDRELKEIHGLKYAPVPYDAAFMDWSDDPYGGGVNFWSIHAKSWEVIPKIVNPVQNVPVYICGEAYSNAQGWVEGALETAELMLQKHFDLPAPDWAK